MFPPSFCVSSLERLRVGDTQRMGIFHFRGRVLYLLSPLDSKHDLALADHRKIDLLSGYKLKYAEYVPANTCSAKYKVGPLVFSMDIYT